MNLKELRNLIREEIKTALTEETDKWYYERRGDKYHCPKCNTNFPDPNSEKGIPLESTTVVKHHRRFHRNDPTYVGVFQ